MNRFLTTVVAVSLTASALPAVAHAASARTSPTITLVSPMRVTVGKTLTVRGRHFKSSKRANKVILEGANGRKVIVKPSRASTTKLTFRVPSAAERILSVKDGAGQPTRVHLRVITNALGARSGLRQSPVVVSARSGDTTTGSRPGSPVPSGGGRTGTTGTTGSGSIPRACGSGNDWDGDLLDNVTELSYGLNPCAADTDGDSMGDGWEYWSAKDLNVRAVPYPGKKPYPNPLDGSDGNIDFDGDSLTSSEEHRAWVVTGRAFNQADPDSPLGYSDGTQTSRHNETPAIPAFRAAQYGLNVLPPDEAYPERDNMRDDGRGWSDDERDADADGLNNYVETHGPGHVSWWPSALATEKPTAPEPWPGSDPAVKYWYYGEFTLRPYQDVALDNPDVDGDTLLDGEDDQDADDYPNYIEMYDVGVTRQVNGKARRVNAFNPCAPNPVEYSGGGPNGASGAPVAGTGSRSCPRYFPIK